MHVHGLGPYPLPYENDLADKNEHIFLHSITESDAWSFEYINLPLPPFSHYCFSAKRSAPTICFGIIAHSSGLKEILICKYSFLSFISYYSLRLECSLMLITIVYSPYSFTSSWLIVILLVKSLNFIKGSSLETTLTSVCLLSPVMMLFN